MHQIKGSDYETARADILDPAWSESRGGAYRSADASLCEKIAHARESLGRAEESLWRMRMSLRGIERTDPEFRGLLSVLHALERSVFNRELELDALLRERRRQSARPSLRGA
jgi:hypothetical protein